MTLYKIEPIQEILKLVFASGYVKNAYPISSLVIAEVGAGKTSVLRRFKNSTNKGIAYITDATAFGIIKHLYYEIINKDIRHIIIPDLITPLSKSKSTVNSFVAFMNALIEEGVVRIVSFAVPDEIKKETKCGLVTSITRSDLFSVKKGWARIGFLSRMIPISYSYDQTDIIRILEKIHINLIDKELVELKLKERDIKISDELAKELIPYSIRISEDMEKILPFRQLKQLQILAMASALLDNNRKEVNKTDIEKIKDLSRYINLKFNPL